MIYIHEHKSLDDIIGKTAITPYIGCVEGYNKAVYASKSKLGDKAKFVKDNSIDYYRAKDCKATTVEYQNGDILDYYIDGEFTTGSCPFNANSGVNIELGEKVTYFNWDIFNKVTTLTGLTVPSSVTGTTATTGGFVTLETLVVMKTYPYFTEIEYNSTVPLTSGVTLYWKAANKLKNLKINNSKIDSLQLPTSLTSLTIGSGVTEINQDLSGLTKLTEINYDTSLTIDSGFTHTASATTTTLNFGENVKTISERAFEGFTKLTDVTMTDSVTRIDAKAFYECDNITAITLSKNLEYFNSITGNFPISDDGISYADTCAISSDKTLTEATVKKGCLYTYGTFIDNNVISSVTLPNTITYIGDETFWCCYSLNYFVFPSSVKYIGLSAFYNSGIMSNEPNNIRFKVPDSVIRIDDGAFWRCTGLTYIELPKYITRIGVQLFKTCTKLRVVVIYPNVTKIEKEAFYGCTSLQNLTFKGTKDQWNSIEKDSEWNSGSSLLQISCTDGIISLI